MKLETLLQLEPAVPYDAQAMYVLPGHYSSCRCAGCRLLLDSVNPTSPNLDIDQPGLRSSEPFQYGFALGDNLKLDFHGKDETTLSHGHVKDQSNDSILKEYTGYECAELDPIVKKYFKKFT